MTTMKFHRTPLAGARLIELEKRGDDRGFFARMFCEREFAAAGLETALRQRQQFAVGARRARCAACIISSARRRRSRSCAACAARCGTRSSICGRTRRPIGKLVRRDAVGREPADDVCPARLCPCDPDARAATRRRSIWSARIMRRPRSAACAGTIRASTSHGRSRRRRSRRRTRTGPISIPLSRRRAAEGLRVKVAADRRELVHRLLVRADSSLRAASRSWRRCAARPKPTPAFAPSACELLSTLGGDRPAMRRSAATDSSISSARGSSTFSVITRPRRATIAASIST